MTDDLTLVVGGRKISGWTGIRVTRGIERMPSDFQIEMTERFPGKADVVVQPGEMCRVLLGNDLVITGYVDRYMPSIAARSHAVAISGRGKCADLVDCSAEWPNSQISGASALEIADKLARPYGITAYSIGDIEWKRIKQFNLNWGETPFEVIDRICRYSAVLAYEDTDGLLVLSRVGETRAASGFVEGQNVQRAALTASMDQRFSEYVVRTMSMSSFSEIGQGGDIQAQVEDEGVKRHRLRYIISEANQPGLDIATQRGIWEAVRRLGRSKCVRLTTDSWRDAAGRLWEPNTLVPVDLPSLKLDRVVWVVGEVTYMRSANGGTTADLVLMPPEAFKPEPYLLERQWNDVTPGPRQ